MAAQMPIGEKAERADHVIDTSGSFDETRNQIRRLLEELRR